MVCKERGQNVASSPSRGSHPSQPETGEEAEQGEALPSLGGPWHPPHYMAKMWPSSLSAAESAPAGGPGRQRTERKISTCREMA